MRKFFIAGVQFHEMKNVKNKIQKDDELILTAEPSNKYDPNAVRIEFDEGEGPVMLGYVPKKFSSEISAMIEVGKELECIVVTMNPAAKQWEMCEVVIKELDEEFPEVEDLPDEEA